jgi:antitoxin (DNA-binding transcriptional repressor) of toxin-antitoxin stability system
MPGCAAPLAAVARLAGLPHGEGRGGGPGRVKYDNLIRIMATRVSATEAVRTFSDLLNRIRYRGEEFVVERAGEPVCRMTPAAPARRLSLKELASLLREIPGADGNYASDVRRAARKQGRLPPSPWER